MIVRNLLEQRSRDDYIKSWFAGEDDLFASLSGEPVSQQTALKLSAVYRCVNTLADDIAKLPIHLFKMSGDDREIDHNHPVVRLLTIQPNNAMVPIVFVRVLEIKRQLWGNGYAHVEVDFDGYPTGLIPLPPEYTLPYIDDSGELWYVLALPGLDKRKLPSADVIHLKGFSTDGVTGHSYIEHGAETIGAGRAEQKFEANFYLRGMKLGGVLEVPTKLSPEDKEIIRNEFERVTSGLSNMHRVAIIDHAQKFTPLNMPIKDAQYIETALKNIKDIARFWGMPLYKLQEGKEAYSSNEQQDLDYMKTVLDPILVQYEQEFRLKLLSRTEQRKRYFRFNRAAQLRTDLKTQGEFLTSMVEGGIYTINEARAYQEMNRYRPGAENPADRLMVSLNYTTIDNLEKVQESKKVAEKAA